MIRSLISMAALASVLSLIGCAEGTIDDADTGGGNTCGNGAIDTGEACDGTLLGGATCLAEGFDGGALSCTASCRLDTSQCTTMTEECGDGVVNGTDACDGGDLAGETCETQGFDGGTLACFGTCTFNTSGCTTDVNSICGDGTVEGVEECDDNNDATEVCDYGQTSCTVCAAGCVEEDGATSFCGDDFTDTDAGEGCDDGNTVTEECAYGEESCTVCNDSCAEVAGATSFCGDSVADGFNGEECDDGNDVDDDSCSNTCTVVGATDCGNNTVDDGEDCDDGNRITEECAYGETSCDVCDSTCSTIAGATSFCGDEVIHVNNGEDCDLGTGNTNECDYGVTTCTVCLPGCTEGPGSTSFCGDGSIDSANGEACDDTNTDPGDGCDANCQIEGSTGDEVEPNNSIGEAQVLTEGDYTGFNVEDGDDDFLSTTVCDGGLLIVTVTFDETAADVDLRLSDTSNGELDTSGTSGGTETVSWLNETGSEAAAVTQVFVYTGTGGTPGADADYDVSVEIRGCDGDDIFEDNDGVFDGPFFEGEQNVSIDNLVAADDDYFTFLLCAGGSVSATASFAHSDGDINLELVEVTITSTEPFTFTSAVVETSTSMDDNETVTHTNNSVGLAFYDVHVIAPAGGSAPYTLAWTLTGCDAAAETGDSCLLDSECISDNADGICLENDGLFPNGYCSQFCDTAGGTGVAAGCNAGDVCEFIGGTTNICFKSCTADTDCRDSEGYECDQFDVCYPAAQ